MRIYRAADKHGIPIRGGVSPAPHSIRRAIEDMRPSEALEFVLEAYENAIGHEGESLQIAFGLGATAPEAEVFCLLHRRLGQTVHIETILSVCNAHRPTAGQINKDTIAVYLSLLRKKLRGKFIITSARAFGYRMEIENDRNPV